MANLEQEILKILLNVLAERGIIPQTVRDKAVNLVHATIDFPEFFEYCLRGTKEDESDGCAKN